MFLLGHSCWSYLISKQTGQRLGVKLPLYLALLSGILPDFDIYFHPYLVHHAYTHSLLVLGPLVLLLSLRYGRLGIAFSTGILSHLLTDGLVGTIPPLYPIMDQPVGLNLGIPSLADTLLETGALAAVTVYAYMNKDYKQFLKPDRKSLSMLITLVSIISLTLLFAGDNNIVLTTLAFSRRALTLITVGHIFQAGALALGTIQGLRAYLAPERTESKQRLPDS